MADYFCWPLWDIGPTGPDNIDPSTLPLTAQLVVDLLAWAARYDAILNMEDPGATAFADDADKADFAAAGYQLAVRVAEELKGQYAVYYFDDMDATRSMITPAQP